MYFQNYWLWKTCLEHSLTGAVSEHALTVIMWKRLKYSRNLHESIFILFFHPFQGSWFGKCLPSVRWIVKGVCWQIDCWWQIFAPPNSNAIIWKTKNFFFIFLFHFTNLHQILSIFTTKMIVIANVFPKLQTVKKLVRTLSEKRCFRTHIDSQRVKSSHIAAISQWQRFHYFFSSFSLKLICKMSLLVLDEI